MTVRHDARQRYGDDDQVHELRREIDLLDPDGWTANEPDTRVTS